MKHTPLALLLSGVTGVALAQALPAFEEVDANGDGSISRQEAAVIEGFDFEAADADQSGALSREEYEAARGE
jgi:hypothetical protein